ncbi:MAG: flagellar biosynthetic protein FliR [Paludibacterium sp.]|uniref:flagellar biosynthetic protein FliR n=1 Tax=Paludibacterium sp. TaxID=1917523 RepID=UPI0025D5A889|nr:flagellar biosynthetic protein FliR [Paludibacterium sp.]MBV8047829.1 flagellar biosynthetic protein FliR [Paludibacterium sp.]MBV8648705.1 flagellar biosynthetic protein FliR [Paludibacterium sp.]
MVTISDTQINALLGLFIWPFTRISGIMMADPFYSSGSTPRTYKAGFALFLTLLVTPVLPKFPVIPLVSAEGVAMLIQQLLIGLSIGFVMRLVMGAVELAGLIIANQMGLGFATMFDPQNASQVPTIATMLTLFVTLLFLAFNGHQVVLATLIDSFQVMPIGKTVPWQTWRVLAEWGSHLFFWGLWLALPVIAALLMTNLAIGVMTRASPQFNIMSFGFPLTLTIGFVALYISLPMMVPIVEQMYRAAFSFALEMFRVTAK